MVLSLDDDIIIKRICIVALFSAGTIFIITMLFICNLSNNQCILKQLKN